jgi:hypothetical protein
MDQIQSAYEKILQDKDSRQAVMIIFDPEKDYLPTKDVPCTNWFHITIRDGKLDWITVMRSNDILWGTPYNMYNFMTFQEIMAGWLGVEVGKYCHIVDCLHIYKDKLDMVKRMIYQEHNSIDIYDYFKPMDARLPKEASQKVMKDMQLLQEALLGHPFRAKDLVMAQQIAESMKGYWKSFAYSLIAYEQIRQGSVWEGISSLSNIQNEFMPSLAQRICRTFFRWDTHPSKTKIWPLINKLPEPVIKFILENPIEETMALEEICV